VGGGQDQAQRAEPAWNACIFMRDKVRYQLQDRSNGSYSLLPMLHKQKHQTQDGHYGQKAKFQILATVKEVVKMPEIFGPWGDSEQDRRQQEEYSTCHGTRLRTLVHPRSAGGVSSFQ
jgi:hypothetical protein